MTLFHEMLYDIFVDKIDVQIDLTGNTLDSYFGQIGELQKVIN